MVHTFKEIRDNIRTTTREPTTIDSLIDNMINLTLTEINDYHPWTFNRRKTTFATVASTEDYQLPRDVDKIGLLRQTSTPLKILYIPDEIFYRLLPNPTATGVPKWYRLWEEEGLSTRLAADDTINVVSSSTADGSSFKVTIVGYSTTGFKQSEEYSLNGTTTVSGTKTFDAGRSIRVSKSANTTGNITVTRATGGTNLVVLGPEERSPRFKIISLYPISSSAITIYLEYYTRIRELVNDTDVPDIDEKWHWVVREGALAKIYQYQNKEQSYTITESRYQNGLLRMKKEDLLNVDYIPTLKNWAGRTRIGMVELSDNQYALTY